jgi:hypothetical protein
MILGQDAPVSYRYVSKMLLHVISFAVVLVPGLHRWWTGRQFRNAGEDPALAERWWALRTRATQVSFMTAFVAAILSPAWMGLLLPVQWLASAIGGFPARRVIFGESWTLGAYLFWSFRLAAGMWAGSSWRRCPWCCHVASDGPPLCAALLIAWQHWVVPFRWSSRDTARRRRRSPALPGLLQGAQGRPLCLTCGGWSTGVDAGERRGTAGHPQSSVLFSNACSAC